MKRWQKMSVAVLHSPSMRRCTELVERVQTSACLKEKRNMQKNRMELVKHAGADVGQERYCLQAATGRSAV
jgi:hypothetical protein